MIAVRNDADDFLLQFKYFVAVVAPHSHSISVIGKTEEMIDEWQKNHHEKFQSVHDTNYFRVTHN